MKMILTIAIVLTISFSLNGQIKKYDIKKKGLTVKPTTVSKLPVLDAKNYTKLPKGGDTKFDASTKKATQLNLTPGAYSNYPAAINATFDASNMRAKNASLAIVGYFDGDRISIANKRRRRVESMTLDFKGSKDKSYRIKVNFNADFNDQNCNSKSIYTKISSSGSSTQIPYKIKKGLNVIDFIIQTSGSYSERVFIFHYNNIISCKEDFNYELIINNLSIRQLED
jgi:hypothetical protein